MPRASFLTMRIALCALLLAVVAPRPAAACIRAGEANKLLGWSADGAYGLYVLVGDKGAIDHAEILPTTYTGFVYTIMAGDRGLIVSRTKVGTCASFGDDERGIVEKKAGTLTEKSILELKTVAALKFGTVEETNKDPRPTAAFTGKKRYEVHDIELTAGETKTVMPLPLYCVGSCLADEDWKKWSISVDGVHHLPGGKVLYELTMPRVCNGGTLHRLVAATPPEIKVPKQRCKGSGE